MNATPTLVHLLDDARPTRAHELLARRFRVVVLEAAGQPIDALVRAIDDLRLDSFNLMGSGAAAETALRLALEHPERVAALVLESPACDGPPPAPATPTLLLLGTRDAASASGHRYKTTLPDCHLVFVYDAAQAIAAERPEAFAEVVADFLERREAFVISRTPTVIHP